MSSIYRTRELTGDELPMELREAGYLSARVDVQHDLLNGRVVISAEGRFREGVDLLDVLPTSICLEGRVDLKDAKVRADQMLADAARWGTNKYD